MPIQPTTGPSRAEAIIGPDRAARRAQATAQARPELSGRARLGSGQNLRASCRPDWPGPDVHLYYWHSQPNCPKN